MEKLVGRLLETPGFKAFEAIALHPAGEHLDLWAGAFGLHLTAETRGFWALQAFALRTAAKVLN